MNNQSALSFYQSHLNNNSEVRPFKFQEPTQEQLNTVLLANLDLEAVKATGDLNQCLPQLKNFTNCQLTTDIINELDYAEFSKLMKLNQLAMEYYIQNQTKQEEEVSTGLEHLQNLQEKLSKLRSIEKNHEEQFERLKRQMANLKEEEERTKAESLRNVKFKCHFCHKIMDTKDILTEHLKDKHDMHKNAAVSQMARPEYLSQLLDQLQNQQSNVNNISYFPNQGGFASTGGLGGIGPLGQVPQTQSMMAQTGVMTLDRMADPNGTGTGWGFANVNILGSKGFEELQKRHDEKQRQKEERRQARHERREREKLERLEKFNQQNSIIKDMESKLEGLVIKKMAEVRELQESLVDEQHQIKQSHIMILETIKNRPLVEVVPRVEEPVRPPSHHEEEEILMEDDGSEQDISRDMQRIGVNQKKMVVQAVNSDQSGVMSFHNYSYTQANQPTIAVRSNQQEAGVAKTKQQLAKNQADMAHIGELESDNEQEDELNPHEGDYLKPLNKKEEVKKAEYELVKAIYHKNQMDLNDYVEGEDDEVDMENLIEVVRKQHNAPEADEEAQQKDMKELQGTLVKMKAASNLDT